MLLIRSNATMGDMEMYCEGSCHVLAVALHRQFGWRLCLVLDHSVRHWEDPDDPDNYIPAVVHAYAVDDQDCAWDIQGVRPMADIASEAGEQFNNDTFDSELLEQEGWLDMYVGCWTEEEGGDPIDRPLHGYEDTDVEEALGVIQRVLDGMPGFPALERPFAPSP